MRRSFFTFLSLALAAALLVPLLSGGDAAAGSSGVKFFVVDWRLSWVEGSSNLELVIKGRTKSANRDLGEEFEITTTKLNPQVLDILKSCATDRLQGSASVSNNDGGKVIGDRLTALNCRAILL